VLPVRPRGCGLRKLIRGLRKMTLQGGGYLRTAHDLMVFAREGRLPLPKRQPFLLPGAGAVEH
jgi:hypothetical protein